MLFDRTLRAATGVVLAGLGLLAVPAPGHAQTTSASVSGSVQDAQGAVLPGVTVTPTGHREQGARPDLERLAALGHLPMHERAPPTASDTRFPASGRRT